MKPTISCRAATAAIALAACLLLTGCFEDSKQDILRKTDNVSTRTQLQEALGEPDNVEKVGPIEHWTYKAKNGAVTFLLADDSLTLRQTVDEKTE